MKKTYPIIAMFLLAIVGLAGCQTAPTHPLINSDLTPPTHPVFNSNLTPPTHPVFESGKSSTVAKAENAPAVSQPIVESPATYESKEKSSHGTYTPRHEFVDYEGVKHHAKKHHHTHHKAAHKHHVKKHKKAATEKSKKAEKAADHKDPAK